MQNRQKSNAEGIDVSHWQGNIDWKAVAADGISFAFVKATQGTSYVDPEFTKNIKGAKAAGVLVGAYHYITAASASAAKQEAHNFATAFNSAGGKEFFDLPPVMDYEENKHGLSMAGITTVARTFLMEVERLTGVKPILYTYQSFIKNFSGLSDYPLWMARYSLNQPEDAQGWTRWLFWQYSDGQQGGYRNGNTRKVAGIAGHVDLNEFDGPPDELKAYFSKREVDPMTTEEKAAFKALQEQVESLSHSKDVLKQTVNEQSAYIKKVDERVKELEDETVPDWAVGAMKTFANTPSIDGKMVIDTPDRANRTFARVMVVLKRLGLGSIQKGDK